MTKAEVPAPWWRYRGTASLLCVIAALAISANGVKTLASPRIQLGRDQLDDSQLDRRDVSVACDSIEQAGEIVRSGQRLESEAVTQQVYLCHIADRALAMTANEPPASPVDGTLKSLYASEIIWPDAYKRDRAMAALYLQVRADDLIWNAISLAIGAIALGFIAMWGFAAWQRRRRERTAHVES